MFEKLKKFFDEGKSMLNEAFTEPEEDDFVTVPEGVTLEQLIEESKQYVDAIIVEPHHSRHQNLVGVDIGDGSHKTDEDIKNTPAQD